MRKIRVKCIDFWLDFRFKDSCFYKILSQKYEVEESETPDILLFSCFGREYLEPRYNTCIKIFFTGESITPDFNLCDYGLCFDHLTFSDRYMRLPLFYTYSSFDYLKKKKMDRTSNQLLNRKFCSFVVSNANADPIREKFYKRLNEYKQVDCGGRLYNNVGGAVADKLDFISQYKFNIAIENYSKPGYTTEKIMESFVSDTVPIYWGNPLINEDFNPSAFINLHDFFSIEDAVQRIVEIDNNDKEYLRFFSYGDDLICGIGKNYEEYLLQFFDNIIDQIETGTAKRIQENSQYKNKMVQALKYHEISFNIKRKISKIIGR